MPCLEAGKLMNLHLDGRLPVEDVRRLERHTLDCPACQKKWTAFREVNTLFARTGTIAPPDDFTAQVMRRVRRYEQGRQQTPTLSLWQRLQYLFTTSANARIYLGGALTAVFIASLALGAFGVMSLSNTTTCGVNQACHTDTSFARGADILSTVQVVSLAVWELTIGFFSVTNKYFLLAAGLMYSFFIATWARFELVRRRSSRNRS